MINFNEYGLLTPASKVLSNTMELEQEFVQNRHSPQRQYLHSCYLNYSSALKSVCGGIELKQWINGSFVTTRNVPGDIDLVTFIDTRIIGVQRPLLNDFKFPESLSLFNVDAYIIEVFSPNHENAFITASDTAYWYDLFTRTKRDYRGRKLPKGFLELFF